MFYLLKKKLDHIRQKKDKLEALSELNDLYSGILAKFFLFFASLFLFNLFLFSLISIFVLVGFVMTEKIPEEQQFYFYLGSIAAAIFSYVFYKLMRKVWKMFRKPAEQELKLEL